MTILVFNIFYKGIHLKSGNTVEKLNVLWYNIVKLMKGEKGCEKKNIFDNDLYYIAFIKRLHRRSARGL